MILSVAALISTRRLDGPYSSTPAPGPALPVMGWLDTQTSSPSIATMPGELRETGCTGIVARRRPSEGRSRSTVPNAVLTQTPCALASRATPAVLGGAPA